MRAERLGRAEVVHVATARSEVRLRAFRSWIHGVSAASSFARAFASALFTAFTAGLPRGFFSLSFVISISPVVGCRDLAARYAASLSVSSSP